MKSKRVHIQCDNRYNRGQTLYYQEGYGFSTFYKNRTIFERENAERIISKLKFNNPRIIEEN